MLPLRLISLVSLALTAVAKDAKVRVTPYASLECEGEAAGKTYTMEQGHCKNVHLQSIMVSKHHSDGHTTALTKGNKQCVFAFYPNTDCGHDSTGNGESLSNRTQQITPDLFGPDGKSKICLKPHATHQVGSMKLECHKVHDNFVSPSAVLSSSLLSSSASSSSASSASHSSSTFTPSETTILATAGLEDTQTTTLLDGSTETTAVSYDTTMTVQAWQTEPPAPDPSGDAGQAAQRREAGVSSPWAGYYYKDPWTGDTICYDCKMTDEYQAQFKCKAPGKLCSAASPSGLNSTSSSDVASTTQATVLGVNDQTNDATETQPPPTEVVVSTTEIESAAPVTTVDEVVTATATMARRAPKASAQADATESTQSMDTETATVGLTLQEYVFVSTLPTSADATVTNTESVTTTTTRTYSSVFTETETLVLPPSTTTTATTATATATDSETTVSDTVQTVSPLPKTTLITSYSTVNGSAAPDATTTTLDSASAAVTTVPASTTSTAGLVAQELFPFQTDDTMQDEFSPRTTSVPMKRAEVGERAELEARENKKRVAMVHPIARNVIVCAKAKRHRHGHDKGHVEIEGPAPCKGTSTTI